MKKFILNLEKLNYRIVCVYLLDSHFLLDPSKFFSGVLSAMSAMGIHFLFKVLMELPHINVLSKIDLISEDVKEFGELDR